MHFLKTEDLDRYDSVYLSGIRVDHTNFFQVAIKTLQFNCNMLCIGS
jgi:hypothetical protein